MTRIETLARIFCSKGLPRLELPGLQPLRAYQPRYFVGWLGHAVSGGCSGSKTHFQFEHALSLMRHTVSNPVNNRSNTVSPWQGVSDYTMNVLQQANTPVRLTAESESMLKSMRSWFSSAKLPLRIQGILQLQPHHGSLWSPRSRQGRRSMSKPREWLCNSRTRRMKAAKKQADTIINDLETELGMARKERFSKEAIDQLRHDLDAHERGNM